MVEDLEKKQFLTYDEQITFLEEKKGLMIYEKKYIIVISIICIRFMLMQG